MKKMKRHVCNYCEFSTEYKPNLNRHYKRKHSTEVASASLGAPSSQAQPYTLEGSSRSMVPLPPHHQQINGYPGQALNLSNNINIPPQPSHQVINIHPTSSCHNQPTPEYYDVCLLYTSPSPRDRQKSRMPSSA